jgi:arginyl-tRNA synthetase
VRATAAAEADPLFDEQSRAYFRALEGGGAEQTSLWRELRDLSVHSYQSTYDRLGVKFDEVSGESVYSAAAADAVAALASTSWVGTEPNGALLADLSDAGMGRVLLRKADGATVYIARDIAAAVERKARVGFDEML